MTVPAGALPPESWTEDAWSRALAERPDLVARLDAGDPTVLAELLALNPDVTVASVAERR